jgi:glycosyltransferase involved in cell wall biosynthesis
MDLLFFDPIPWDYDVSTPAERPLGGSQSALCYLAAELARRGHQVSLVNHVPNAREVQGVRCIPERELTADLLAQSRDAVIVLNGPADLGPQLRRYLPPCTSLVLWTQHSYDQPAVTSLQQPEVRAAWDRVVCISAWQRDRYLEKFPLDPNRLSILRNAIAPTFEQLFTSPADLIQAKPAHPVLAYTSTPFRGLNVLAAVFRPLHQEFPDAELQVYSSMKVYHVPQESDQFTGLYERCRSLPGGRYFGSISQRDLAVALRGATILSYPNTFAETSCIAVMEAMAAGAHVVTTDLGALPETTLGRATLVPPMQNNDATAFGSQYYQVLRSVLATWRKDPANFAAAQFEQVREINASCTWSARAREWESVLPSWKS